VTYANSAAAEIFDSTVASLVGRRFIDGIAPDDWNRASEDLATLLQTGAPVRTEYSIVRRGGARFTADVVAKTTSSRASVAVGLWDISARHEADQDRALEQRRLERFVRDRTVELEATNARLIREVAERKQKERAALAQREAVARLAGRLARAEEQERRRIAEILHDRIGQSLAGLRVGLMGLPQGILQEAAREISSVMMLLDETVSDIRHLMFELSPPILYELGLGPAAEWLCDDMRSRCAVEFSADVRGLSAGDHLDSAERSLAFRVLTELLQNVVKHAHARRATATLSYIDGDLILRVEDDGIGFDRAMARSDVVPAADSGFGLFSIRERLRPLGGGVKISSGMKKGACVTVLIPCPGSG